MKPTENTQHSEDRITPKNTKRKGLTPTKKPSQLTAGIAATDIGNVANATISDIFSDEKGQSHTTPDLSTDPNIIVAEPLNDGGAGLSDGVVVASSIEAEAVDNLSASDAPTPETSESGVVEAVAVNSAGADAVVQAEPIAAQPSPIILVDGDSHFNEDEDDEDDTDSDELDFDDTFGNNIDSETDEISDISPMEDGDNLVF